MSRGLTWQTFFHSRALGFVLGFYLRVCLWVDTTFYSYHSYEEWYNHTYPHQRHAIHMPSCTSCCWNSYWWLAKRLTSHAVYKTTESYWKASIQIDLYRELKTLQPSLRSTWCDGPGTATLRTGLNNLTLLRYLYGCNLLMVWECGADIWERDISRSWEVERDSHDI